MSTNASLCNDALFHCIENGEHKSLTEMLMDRIVDVNTHIWWDFDTQHNGKIKLELPLLHIASSKGHYMIASALIKFGAFVDATDKYGTTAIHWASTSGQNKIIKLLLKHDGNINQRDRLGMSPLMCAAYSGRTKTLKYLLKMGADKSIASNQNELALDIAQSQNNKNCVNVLINANMKNKANKSKTQRSNTTLIHEYHDRISSTVIHDTTKRLSTIPKRDISQLILRESSSSSSALSEDEEYDDILSLKEITEERVNELKVESRIFRSEIKSLQSDTKYLKSLRKSKHKKSEKHFRKELKEAKRKLVELSKEQQLTKSKLNKKKKKLKGLKQHQAKWEQNMILSGYNAEELKKQLYDKLSVLRQINVENCRLRKEFNENSYTAIVEQKQLNFNRWLNDVVRLPNYKMHFEKYEYNRLDVVKLLDGKELKRMKINNLKHRLAFIKQIHILQRGNIYTQVGV